MSISASPVHSIHEYANGIYKVVTFKGSRDPDNAYLRIPDATQHYQRGDHTGLAASVQSIFGDYQPLMATDSAGNVSAVSGLAGVDFCWIGGCLAFLILFYSFFRLLGGVFLGRSK